MPDCSLCGASDARHHHIADLEGAIARAPAADWTNTVVDGETRSVRVHLPADAGSYICDRCASAYAAAHPDFQPRPGLG